MTSREFTAEYEAGAARVLGFVRRQVRSEELAEDIAAQAWLKAWARRDQFDGRNGSRFLTWVNQIALNLVREHWRRRDPLKGAENVDQQVLALRARFHDPGVPVDAAMLLRRATGSFQTVVRMRFLMDLNVEDVSRALGMTANTVKAQTRRGLLRMAGKKAF
jgi:RNA polymerase sigma factor (sigma-70 family)